MKRFQNLLLGALCLGITMIGTAALVHAQEGSPPEQWEFQVGPKAEKYSILIKIIPYPSEVAPISGTLFKGTTKIGSILPCTAAQMQKSTPPFVMFNGYKMSVTCSSVGGGEEGVAYTLRFGNQAWLFSTGLPVTGTSDGKIYNVQNGQVIGNFIGRKVK